MPRPRIWDIVSYDEGIPIRRVFGTAHQIGIDLSWACCAQSRDGLFMNWTHDNTQNNSVEYYLHLEDAQGNRLVINET